MARGTQFLEIVTRTKSESGRLNSVAVGVDELANVKEAINSVYATLYMDHDWPHLRKTFTVSLAAGQRYYNFPSGLNVERLEEVYVNWNDIRHRLDRPIDFEDYNDHDSDLGERNDPVLKWDVRWTGSSEQIEFWPIPATPYTVYFRGIQDAPRLVNDSDVCLLDDTLVVLFSAASLLSDEKESEKKLKLAQQHLANLKVRGKGGSSEFRLGIGHGEERVHPRAVVRVSGG